MPTNPVLRLTVSDLVAAVGCSATLAADWIDPLSGAAFIYDINTPARMAAWLGTIAHESSGLSQLEENLSYSAKRIPAVWPNRFGPGKANPNDYANEPAKLANFVYANRMGNGPEESWDGWNYRGRGPIQLTGKENYREAGKSVGNNLLGMPELVIEPPIGAMTAAWYWTSRGLNDFADDDDFGSITIKVAGALTDYANRLKRWHYATKAMERFT